MEKNDFYTYNYYCIDYIYTVRRCAALFVGGAVGSPDLLLSGFQHFRAGRPDDGHVDDVYVRCGTGLALGPFGLLVKPATARDGGGQRCRGAGHGGRRLDRGTFRRRDAAAAVVLRAGRHGRRFLLGVWRRGRHAVVVAGKVERRLGWHVAVHLRRFHGVCKKGRKKLASFVHMYTYFLE